MENAPVDLLADKTAMFLDVDGTLLGIREHPADVRADNELIALLGEVERRFGGALSLISGRSIEEIDRIFAPVAFPAAGAHGVEFRYSDGAEITSIDAHLPETIINTIESFAAAHDGLLAERKRAGLALHYRRAPELESDCRRLIDEVMHKVGATFRLIDGKMVLEIAPRGHDKGEAIRKMLHHVPFSGRQPVFVGDDVTDEDGFRAVNELGGVSIRVGSGRSTAARYRLDDVAGVHAWLRALMD